MQGLALVKLSTQILSTSFLDEYRLGTKLSLRSVIHCSIEHKDQMLREVPVMSKIGISHPICVAVMHKFRTSAGAQVGSRVGQFSILMLS